MTPASEVDLCGHATLASAWVVMNRLEPGRRELVFDSRSGELPVVARGERLVLDFPSRPPEPAASLDAVAAALGARPSSLLAARDYLALFESEDQVRALRPEMAQVAALDRMAVIATAPGRDCDFVSRFFAPAVGVPEDPVTGSAHSTLVPYWSRRLGGRSYSRDRCPRAAGSCGARIVASAFRSPAVPCRSSRERSSVLRG